MPYVGQNPAQVEHVQGHVQIQNQVVQDLALNIPTVGRLEVGVVVVEMAIGVPQVGVAVLRAVATEHKLEPLSVMHQKVRKRGRSHVTAVMAPYRIMETVVPHLQLVKPAPVVVLEVNPHQVNHVQGTNVDVRGPLI